MMQKAEILSSVLTVDDGLRVIANLEMKRGKRDKTAERSEETGEGGLSLDDFKQLFYQMPVVGLTLAFNPSRSFLSGVRDWFSQNLGKTAVVKLEVDPELIGGVKLVCNDHYLDLSVSAKLDEAFGNISHVEANNLGKASTLI